MGERLEPIAVTRRSARRAARAPRRRRRPAALLPVQHARAVRARAGVAPRLLPLVRRRHLLGRRAHDQAAARDLRAAGRALSASRRRRPSSSTTRCANVVAARELGWQAIHCRTAQRLAGAARGLPAGQLDLVDVEAQRARVVEFGLRARRRRAAARATAPTGTCGSACRPARPGSRGRASGSSSRPRPRAASPAIRARSAPRAGPRPAGRRPAPRGPTPTASSKLPSARMQRLRTSTVPSASGV